MAYLDLHIHTKKSDGIYTKEEILKQAKEKNIQIIAFTDHNQIHDDQEIFLLHKQYPEIHIISGCEFSTKYYDYEGKQEEIHVVGLNIDVNNPKILEIIKHNNPDRSAYINKTLDKLRMCNIDLGTYEDVKRRFPDLQTIKRPHIARMMYEQGYVNSIEEAFQEYVGKDGKRKAYVDAKTDYCDFDKVITTIIEAGGIPILAHPLHYDYDHKKIDELLTRFKQLSKEKGAMETYYQEYDQNQRKYLHQLAIQYQLMESGSSDFHGTRFPVLIPEFETSNIDFKKLLHILNINV